MSGNRWQAPHAGGRRGDRRRRHGHARPALHPGGRLGGDQADRLGPLGRAAALRPRRGGRGHRPVGGGLRRRRRGHVRRAGRGVGGLGAGRGRARRGLRGQLGRVPDGPGGAAGGARGQPRRRAAPPQGRDREPELHHALADRGGRRAAPRVRPRGDGRRLLPGRLRRRAGGHRHALRAAGEGRRHPHARPAAGRRAQRGRRPRAVPGPAGAERRAVGGLAQGRRAGRRRSSRSATSRARSWACPRCG